MCLFYLFPWGVLTVVLEMWLGLVFYRVLWKSKKLVEEGFLGVAQEG